MKFYATRLVIFGLFSCMANAASIAEEKSNDERQPRFQIVSAMSSAVMVDSDTGKTWFLEATDQGVAWMPIRRIDDGEQAQALRKSDGKWSKEIGDVLDAEVPMESLRVAIAKQRADLRRLLKEFGAKHPEVLQAAERVRQLEKISRGATPEKLR